MPAGKRLASMLPELTPVLRRHDELVIDDDSVVLLSGCRRPPSSAGWRPNATNISFGAAVTPSRDAAREPDPDPHVRAVGRRVAGFVEIDLVGHEGGNAVGEHAYTLRVTDRVGLDGEP